MIAFDQVAASIGGQYEPPANDHGCGVIRVNPFWWCQVRLTNPRGYGPPLSHIRANSPRDRTLARGEEWTANISSEKSARVIGAEIMRRVLAPSREAMRRWHEKHQADQAQAQQFRILLDELGQAIGQPLQETNYNRRQWEAPGVKFSEYGFPNGNGYRDTYTAKIEVRSLAALKMILAILREDQAMQARERLAAQQAAGQDTTNPDDQP